MTPRPLELLAPARDLNTAREAILHGADAVYIGAEGFGARARAANSLADIRALVEFAAPYGVKVYITVNTIIYDSELQQVEQLIRGLYAAGVDALIIQDLGICRLDIPPIALHASTQCDTRTPEKAKFLEALGMSQIVIARESSLEETAAICRAVPQTPVEAFVHGALCVSYSGDCRASLLATGRSANRGECAQICRMQFTLTDGNGRQIGRAGHYLSLRDLNRIHSLGQMAEAGVSSFKIEGRLKDAAYVKNVTAAYRQALDNLIAANPDKYCRASRGTSRLTFIPDIHNSFNRGFTNYFLTSASDPGKMAGITSPKALGEEVGTVINSRGTRIEAKLTRHLNNGDGLTYITPDGATGGFRANRVEGNTIITVTPVPLAKGTRLMRNHDRVWEEQMAAKTAVREIDVDLTLRSAGQSTLVLEGYIKDVGTVCVSCQSTFEAATRADNGYRLKTLSKTGDTIFRVNSLDDRLEGIFIPASTLSALRRLLTDTMLSTLMCRHIPERRRPIRSPQLPQGHQLSYADNIANTKAAEIYKSAGATGAIPRAAETDLPPRDKEFRVMTTRYCLRRELGDCLKEGGHKTLVGPLCLTSANNLKYRLDFDCKACRMNVIAQPDKPKI